MAMTPEEKRAKRTAYMREYTRRNAEKINQQRRSRRTKETLDRENLWRKTNRSKVLKYKKADREKRPDDYKRWKREWAIKNQVKITAKRKAEYAANKTEISERLKRFRELHPERWKKAACHKSQRRRARLANVHSEHIDRDVLYERDGRRCGICRKTVARKDISIDHIIPISKGGDHLYSNVQLAHTICNKRRSNKLKAQKRLFG